MRSSCPAVYVNGHARTNGFSKRTITPWLCDLLRVEGRPGAVVSLTFVDSAAMTALNERYTGRRGTTDVLAFSQQEGDHPAPDPDLLGDVIVDIHRVRAQARECGVTRIDEMLRVVAHGFLHLLGYDHASPGERLRMRRAEELHILRYRTGQES